MERSEFERFLERIRRLVDETLIPAERRVDGEDAIPDEIVGALRALGLFGMAIPPAWGGLGLSMVEEARAVLALGRAAPAFRSCIGTGNGLGSQGILAEGSAAQRDRWLPRIARGEVIAAFALSEPEAGSDAAAVATRARRDGDGWVLDGRKCWVTNGPRAGLYTVLARSDEAAAPARGISAFLVERGAPGLALGEPDRKMGLRGAPTCDLVLERCRVPADALLGREGGGFKLAMRLLDRQRIHISAVCAGLAGRLVDEALAHAATRRQFGQPLAELQLVQAMLADSRAEAYAARTMVLDAAGRRDAGEDVSTDAACCKLYCAEMVTRVADRAMQIHGGAGYRAGAAVERLYRDARLFPIFEGSTQIQQIVIARNMLREQKVRDGDA